MECQDRHSDEEIWSQKPPTHSQQDQHSPPDSPRESLQTRKGRTSSNLDPPQLREAWARESYGPPHHETRKGTACPRSSPSPWLLVETHSVHGRMQRLLLDSRDSPRETLGL